ncbi:tyrosine-type recombinase/integrase [Nodosilinea sp. LEGE 06152]|uniref:tyrosine-type recombinase/integrase n=1 Tax=Nodosilinea sp. LEGE 06152 TaxID=2777966 RepID=UPI001880DFD9|nr:tyrosine-type recombinase/integrase [Nodosilinea sp. LEGE 06152]MBE9157051.1 tyrosine-type recombinase/integrase [Nodosilinea sp. LEGE 06152]
MRSLFSICYYTGCRVSEARQLRAEDVVGETLVLRKATTKTKRTRAVPIHPKLKAVLAAAELPGQGYLFPGRSGQGPITRQACDLALRKDCCPTCSLTMMLDYTAGL